ncbi:protein ORF103 [Cyprinid herpesvirus 2]|nr:protein ORF103 [Cyprinid herpesvirus 2]QIM55273.1 hypothetical protein [Cyprinid herpesvirus 2]
MDCICETLSSPLSSSNTCSMDRQTSSWSLCCSEARWSSPFSSLTGDDGGVLRVSELVLVGSDRLPKGHWLLGTLKKDIVAALVELGTLHLCRVSVVEKPGRLDRPGITHCAATIKCLVEKTEPEFYALMLTNEDASSFFAKRGLPPHKTHTALRDALSRVCSGKREYFDTDLMTDSRGNVFRLMGTFSLLETTMIVVYAKNNPDRLLGLEDADYAVAVPFYPSRRTTTDNPAMLQVLLTKCLVADTKKASLCCLTRNCGLWNRGELLEGYTNGFAYDRRALFWKPLISNYPPNVDETPVRDSRFKPEVVFVASEIPRTIFEDDVDWETVLKSKALHWQSLALDDKKKKKKKGSSSSRKRSSSIETTPTSLDTHNTIINPKRVKSVDNRDSSVKISSPSSFFDKSTTTAASKKKHPLVSQVSEEEDVCSAYRIPGDDTLRCVGFVCQTTCGRYGGGNGFLTAAGTAELNATGTHKVTFNRDAVGGYSINSSQDAPSPPTAVMFTPPQRGSDFFFKMRANHLGDKAPVTVEAHSDPDFKPCSIEHLPSCVASDSSSRSDLAFPFWGFWNEFCDKEPDCVIYTFYGNQTYIQIVVDKSHYHQKKAQTFGVPQDRTYTNPLKLLLHPIRRDDVRGLFFWYQKSSAVTGHLLSDQQ